MRFQTSETVPTRDAERVLSALEECLREMSGQVERRGDRITLHGLGPSPRVKNYHDTTVLCVNALEDRTVIVADVSFQASSLLGDVRQDEVVRSKLDTIFDQMRAQLKTDKSETYRATEGVKKEAMPLVEIVSEPRSHKAEDVVVVQETNAFVAEETEPVLWTRTETADPQEERTWWRWIAVAVVGVLLVAGYLLRAGGWQSVVWMADAVRQKASSGMVSQGDSAKSVENEREAAKAPVKADDAFYARGTADPKAWLAAWADAMRTKDPLAQASYYADRVERYMTKSNVSREEIAEMKREGISGRRGLWTVKMEDVVVERRTPSEVDVRLVKHFMEAPVPGEMTEMRVRSKLRLRRVDGEWKIVREDNLPEARITAGG